MSTYAKNQPPYPGSIAAELPVPENSQTPFPILSDNLWRLGQTCGFLGPRNKHSTAAVDVRCRGNLQQLGIGESVFLFTNFLKGT